MSAEHTHSHAPADFSRAFAIGISLNLIFVAIEAFYGWRVNSLALLADAGHNLSDVAGLVLAWSGSLALKKRATPRYTYGWKRATILAAFINAVLLLIALGALGWEAIDRLLAPEQTVQEQGKVIMVVAGVGILINALTAALFLRGSKSDLNIRGAFIHMAADALVSAGVVVVGALTLWVSWSWLDPVVSLIIAVVILLTTLGLFKQSIHLLFDGVPDSIDSKAVHDYFMSHSGVSSIQDLHIWAIGTTQTALTVHLIMPDRYPEDAFFQEVNHYLHDNFEITHVTIQVNRQGLVNACGDLTYPVKKESNHFF
ncbi:MAG: cation diffusion facilitator family transporter [Betaproteobacteria bacterium]